MSSAHRNCPTAGPSDGESTRQPTTSTKPLSSIPMSTTSTMVNQAGEFRLGHEIGSYPVKSLQSYLARRDNTDEFYVLKVLTLPDEEDKLTAEDIGWQKCFINEYLILSLAKNEAGVIRERGIFGETVKGRVVNENGEESFKEVRRLFHVLDCFVGHSFSPKYRYIDDMQRIVSSRSKLPEIEALGIFCKLVKIVERLHELNIVHKNLKLSSIYWNKSTEEVTLANFYFAKHLKNNGLIMDQCVVPYPFASPELLSGRPYLGKPSDMWTLGVDLYVMLFGRFPFNSSDTLELFKQIKLGTFYIPVECIMTTSLRTKDLINCLLTADPTKRPTASETLEEVRSIIRSERPKDLSVQVVPDCPPGIEQLKRPLKRHVGPNLHLSFDFAADVAKIAAQIERDSASNDQRES